MKLKQSLLLLGAEVTAWGLAGLIVVSTLFVQDERDHLFSILPAALVYYLLGRWTSNQLSIKRPRVWLGWPWLVRKKRPG